MADRIRDASPYRRDQDLDRSAYGRGYSDENRGSSFDYERGGRGERFYGSSDDRGAEWSGSASGGTLSTLAIGAGLGLLAGLMVTGARQLTGNGQFGGADRGQRGSDSLETDESFDLIASNKVEGTAVYDRQGTKLGEVYNFMVGKRSGRVAYAVVSFGGMMGIGGSQFPLPWNVLDYDPGQGGYVVDIDKDQLSRAPSHAVGQDAFSNPEYGRSVSNYWSGSTANL